MDETKIMATAISLSLLSNKREQALFEKELCNTSVATAGEEAGVQDELTSLMLQPVSDVRAWRNCT